MPSFARPVVRLRRTALAALALLAVSPSAAHAVGAMTTGWVTDGPVKAAVTDAAGRTYITGDFGAIGPRLGHAIAMTTGADQPLPGLPDVAGTVSAIVSDGAGGWFIGGEFTRVGGVAREHLAHLGADRTLDPTWNPAFSGSTVNALLRSGDALYVAGDFTAVGGVTTKSVAKLSTTGTGAGDPAFSAFRGVVVGNALALEGGSLFAGGAGGLRKLDAATGIEDFTFGRVYGTVKAVAVGAGSVFVGGTFIGSLGPPASDSPYLQKLSMSGVADVTWNPGVEGVDAGSLVGVDALALVGPDLYLGGSFAKVGGQARDGVARVTATGTGAVQAWAPAFAATGRHVRAITVDGDAVYLGGDLVAGSRRNLVRVSAAGAAADAWAPDPTGPVQAVGVAGGAVLVGGAFATAGDAVARRGGLVRLAPDGSLDASWTPPVVTGAPAALALSGDALFVGGAFDVPGSSDRVMKFSTVTAVRDAGWASGAQRSVTALVVAGSNLFVGQGGDAPAGDGVIKQAVADPGTRDLLWAPGVTKTVTALAATGSTLFVGGYVLGAGSLNRSIVKLPTFGPGTVDAAWDPGVFGSVAALAPAGDDLVVAGSLFSIDGGPPKQLIKVAANELGPVDKSWAPEPNRAVTALAIAGGNVYAGGFFTTISGASHRGLARIPLAGTGAPDPVFDASVDGSVLALTASAERVVAGGSFQITGSLSTAGVAVFDLLGSAPLVSLAVPADGSRYRVGQPATAAFGCSDPDGPADLVSCVGTAPAGGAFDTSSPGAKTFTVTATDAVGHTATQTNAYVVDGSAPVITIGALPGGASYALGEQVPVSYGCADPDGASDVATCVGPVPSGGRLDTATAGAKTFTVTATDLVGNPTTSAVSYSVRPAQVAPPPAKDTTKPTLSALTFSPSTFRAEKAGAPTGKTTKKKLKVGTKVSFKLSEAATVTFTVVAPKQGKTKAKTLGRFTVKGLKGTTTFVFRGRIAGKTLKPGSYQLSVQATDAARLKSAVLKRTVKVKR